MPRTRNTHDRLKWLALAAASLPAAAQAQDCTAPVTQSAMQRCASDEFLDAQADYASRYKALAN